VRVRRGRAVGIVAAVLAVMVVAAACDPSNTDGGPLASEGVGGSLSGGGVGLTPFTNTGRRSVLVRFFDAADGVNASEAAAREAAWAVYTEILVSCVREQGFEYYTYPYLQDGQGPYPRAVGSDFVEPVDREGFGIVVAPDGVAMSQEDVRAAQRRAEEMNAAYVASLGEVALREYYLVLVGFDPAEEGSNFGGEGFDGVLSEDEKQIWETGGPGCEGEANRAVERHYTDYYAQAGLDQEMDDVLRDRLSALLERYVSEVETDAGVREVLGGYQRCMISAGWSVGLPGSALELLYEPPRELVEMLRAQGPDVLVALEAGDVPRRCGTRR